MRSPGEIAALVRAAAERNRRRDAIDRGHGNATPGDSDDAMLARTAIDALECALAIDDWDCVAEAVAMLTERWGGGWHRPGSTSLGKGMIDD